MARCMCASHARACVRVCVRVCVGMYTVCARVCVRVCVGMCTCMSYFLAPPPPRPDEVVTPRDDPMVQEISDVLREWSLVWKRLYAVRGWLGVVPVILPRYANRCALYCTVRGAPRGHATLQGGPECCSVLRRLLC